MRYESEIISVLAAVASLSAASAADLPTHKPAPRPPTPLIVEQLHDWSGAYVGGTTGFGWSGAEDGYSISSSSLPTLSDSTSTSAVDPSNGGVTASASGATSSSGGATSTSGATSSSGGATSASGSSGYYGSSSATGNTEVIQGVVSTVSTVTLPTGQVTSSGANAAASGSTTASSTAASVKSASSSGTSTDPAVDPSGTRRATSHGVLLGGEIGYNWRLKGQFVVGVEADSEWSDMAGSAMSGGSVPNLPSSYSYAVTQKFDPDWQGSLRLRAGFTPLDCLLVYATGGVAVAHVDYTSAFTDYAGAGQSVSSKDFRPGATIGAGAEFAFSRNWSVKAEYRYSRFEAAGAASSNLSPSGTAVNGSYSSGALSENTVRLGLNYHLN